jgi:hypothetical protein
MLMRYTCRPHLYGCAALMLNHMTETWIRRFYVRKLEAAYMLGVEYTEICL